MIKIEDLTDISKKVRLSCLEMAYQCGKNGSHLGAGLSSVEILTILLGGVMNHSSDNPRNPERDRLVVSKGHCVLAYYSALREFGYLSDQDIDSFEVNGSEFHGHAIRNLDRGIEFSGGSLSMGLSFAVGEALACKRMGYGNRVFVLVGDGECDEGLIWEAAMSASHFKLDNLVIVVDCNRLQYDGMTAEIMNHNDLGAKFSAFGFYVVNVDGHDCLALHDALSIKMNQPTCVIAHTTKGKGVSFMENNKEWHHHVLSREQYELAKEEVERV